MKGEFKLKHEDVIIQYQNQNLTQKHYRQKHLTNTSLDTRCSNGQNLSVGFIMYRPYVETIHDREYLILTGIIPALLSQLLNECCKRSKVVFGEFYSSIRQAEEHFEAETDWDFTFPLYGLEGSSTKQYKDSPFIPLVEAPRLVLLVPDSLFESKNTRTQVLLRTVLNAWPMLIFISVSACLSGLIVWFLDRQKNPGEFPPTFFVGAWEGFWWAFVTMTTVGYGDRSPKSILARMFCIFWILCGIILISLFTGLVTAALSVSATPVFNIPGAKIGAVSGSKEYQVGVGMNADMRAYDHHHQLFEDLIIHNKLDGVIIDNFILSSIHRKLEEHKLRIEREIPYPVMYGTALGPNSSKVESCFRRYIRHNPQKMFEKISEKLFPVRNPTDDVRVEVIAAEKLFYQEKSFKLVVYVQTGCLALFMAGGIIWEFFVRNKPSDNYGILHKTARTKKDSMKTEHFRMDNLSDQRALTDIDGLINEYNVFHEKWMNKLQMMRVEVNHSVNGTTSNDIDGIENNN
eukprot:gene298-924_t